LKQPCRATDALKAGKAALNSEGKPSTASLIIPPVLKRFLAWWPLVLFSPWVWKKSLAREEMVARREYSS